MTRTLSRIMQLEFSVRSTIFLKLSTKNASGGNSRICFLKMKGATDTVFNSCQSGCLVFECVGMWAAFVAHHFKASKRGATTLPADQHNSRTSPFFEVGEPGHY